MKLFFLSQNNFINICAFINTVCTGHFCIAGLGKFGDTHFNVPKRTIVIISGKSKIFENGKNHLPDLSNVVVKDLREYGVEQAGTYKGGVEAYKGMLNKIRSGSILSEQDAIRLIPKTEETKKRIQKQIDS